MSDTHERPTLPRTVEQEHPYTGMERFWESERGRSYTKVSIGLAGLSADFLLALALMNGASVDALQVTLGLIAIAVASISSIWLVEQGMGGLKDIRPLPRPHQHRSIRGGRQESIEKFAEKQVLEAIESQGEITPARAALETSLTVDEAERLLGELAQRGHLDVRVEGSKLVYSL